MLAFHHVIEAVFPFIEKGIAIELQDALYKETTFAQQKHVQRDKRQVPKRRLWSQCIKNRPHLQVQAVA